MYLILSFLFLLSILIALIIIPILVDEYSVRRGYYWTGAIFGLGFYYLVVFLYGLALVNLQADYTGDIASYTVFAIAWLTSLLGILFKVIWIKLPHQGGGLPTRYRLRHIVAPILTIDLWFFGGLINLLGKLGIPEQIVMWLLKVWVGPASLIAYPWYSLAALIASALVVWLVYRWERKAHLDEDGLSLLRIIRSNRKKMIHWAIGVCIWIIVILPVINQSVYKMMVGIKETIRLQQPGVARFHQIYGATIVGNLLFFQGTMYESDVDCRCIYAVDMNTGKIAWSTETLADEEKVDTADFLGVTYSPSSYYIDSFSADEEIAFISKNHEFYAFDVDTGRVIWQKPSKSFNSFGAYENGIFIEVGGNLQKVNAKTGNTEWSLNIQDSGVYSISFTEDGLGMVTLWKDEDNLSLSDSFLVLDARSGRGLWQIDFKDTDQWVTSAGGLIYRIAVDDHPDLFKVYAYDRVTGKEVWVFDKDDSTRQFSYLGRVNDRLILSVEDSSAGGVVNRLIGLDGSTGNILWTVDFDHPFSAVQGDPAGKLAIITAENEKEITAVDLNSGVKIWKYVSDDNIQDLLNLADELVIMTNPNTTALDAASGTVRWQRDGLLLLPQYSPNSYGEEKPRRHLRGDIGYSTDEDGSLILVDLSTGRDLWRWQSPDESLTGYIVGEVTDEYVIVYNSENHDRVFVLSPEGELVFYYLK